MPHLWESQTTWRLREAHRRSKEREPVSPGLTDLQQQQLALCNTAGCASFRKLHISSRSRLRDIAEKMAQGIRTSGNEVYVLRVVAETAKTVNAYWTSWAAK